MWDFASSISAWAFLSLFMVASVYAISINDNRLDEVRFIEQTLIRNSQKLSGLGRAAIDPHFTANHPEVDAHYRYLLFEAAENEKKAYELNYKRMYGSGASRRKIDDLVTGQPPQKQDARVDRAPVKPQPKVLKQDAGQESEADQKLEQHEEGYRARVADYFHARSDTTNTMIIGMSACAIAVSATKLLAATKALDHRAETVFFSLTIFDVALGTLTGLLTTFVVKSGSNALSNTSIGNIDVSSPYGVAFVAAVVGLFNEKFYSWLQPAAVASKPIAPG